MNNLDSYHINFYTEEMRVLKKWLKVDYIILTAFLICAILSFLINNERGFVLFFSIFLMDLIFLFKHLLEKQRIKKQLNEVLNGNR